MGKFALPGMLLQLETHRESQLDEYLTTLGSPHLDINQRARVSQGFLYRLTLTTVLAYAEEHGSKLESCLTQNHSEEIAIVDIAHGYRLLRLTGHEMVREIASLGCANVVKLMEEMAIIRTELAGHAVTFLSIDGDHLRLLVDASLVESLDEFLAGSAMAGRDALHRNAKSPEDQAASGGNQRPGCMGSRSGRL